MLDDQFVSFQWMTISGVEECYYQASSKFGQEKSFHHPDWTNISSSYLPRPLPDFHEGEKVILLTTPIPECVFPTCQVLANSSHSKQFHLKSWALHFRCFRSPQCCRCSWSCSIHSSPAPHLWDGLWIEARTAQTRRYCDGVCANFHYWRYLRCWSCSCSSFFWF